MLRRHHRFLLAIHLRSIQEKVEHIEATGLLVPVDVRPAVAQALELRQAFVGGAPEFGDLSERNRPRRASLRAGGPQPVVNAVVAQRALVDRARGIAQGDHTVGAGRDAILAADADVLLDDDVSQVGADDGAGGAGVQAAGVVAMLARIARKIPSRAGAILAELLDEADVPPIGGAQGSGVVVGVAGEVDGDRALLHGIEPEMTGFVGKGVPFLARYLAG